MAQFMSTMAKSPEARTMCFAEHDRLVKDYGGEEGAMLFMWDSIKWYDSYEGIRAIEDFVQWAECEEIDVGDEEKQEANYFFKFVRTGEDMDDNEQRGYGFDDIYVERSITF